MNYTISGSRRGNKVVCMRMYIIFGKKTLHYFMGQWKCVSFGKKNSESISFMHNA